MDPRPLPPLLALLLLPLVASVQAQPADAPEPTVLYLTGVDGQGIDGTAGLTLAPSIAGTAGSVTFTPLTGGIGLPIDTGAGSDEQVWHGTAQWDEDQELLGDVTVRLWFQGAGDVAVELLDVHPDGSLRTLGEDRRSLSRQGQEPQEETFRLPSLGEVMEERHGLRLRVAIDSITSAITMHYDAEDTPASVSLAHEPLDSDDDGISDRLERAMGTDPLDPTDPDDRVGDSDGDGLSDEREAELGTDPTLPDSDGDGWSDGAEVRLGTDPTESADAPTDTDGDGLSDAWERDRLGDLSAGPTDDPDADGLTNLQEQQHGTDPTDADTDDDGTDDGAEVAQGRDPLCAANDDRPEPSLLELGAGLLLAIATAGLATVGLLRRHAL